VSDDLAAWRERAACHEAAHAAMSYVLGVPLDLVSIGPTARWGGVCFSRPLRVCDELDVDRPLPLQPARLRRGIETRIMVALAGPLGELYARPKPAGYEPPAPDEQVAHELAARLTGEERELLSCGEEPGGQSDREDARRLAWALAGAEEAEALVSYLGVATRPLVLSARFRHLLEALAAALLEQEVLGGRAVRRILQSEDETT